MSLTVPSSDQRPRPTPEERALLRRFIVLVDEMSRSRFIEQYRSQNHTIEMKEEYTEAVGPEYDREDFEAFLTRFRQVAISTNEPVYFTKTLKIVAKYASPKLREYLPSRRKLLLRLLVEKNWSGIQLSYPTTDGKEVKLTSHQVLDAVVNGWVFHADPGHQPVVELLTTSKPWFYLWPLLVEIVCPTLKALIWLFKVIRIDGILPDEDYPKHCLQKSTQAGN